MEFNHITLKEYMNITSFKQVSGGYLGFYEAPGAHLIKIYILNCISNKGYKFNLIKVLYYRGDENFLNDRFDKIIEVGKSKQGKRLLSGNKYINYNNRTFKKLD